MHHFTSTTSTATKILVKIGKFLMRFSWKTFLYFLFAILQKHMFKVRSTKSEVLVKPKIHLEHNTIIQRRDMFAMDFGIKELTHILLVRCSSQKLQKLST